ncbi:MAG: glycosyltransferase family 4 protein [Saprospiraceae bacterium]
MTVSLKSYKILVISDYREINSSRPEAEIFVNLAKKGHEITILSYPDATFYNTRFRSVGIKVLETHPTKKIALPIINYLRQLIIKEQFDFVHAFNSLGLTNAVWAMIGLNSKLITYRGYAGNTHWYDPMMFLKYFHPRVDMIICNSEITRDILAKNMPWAKNKLTVILKGHDPEWLKDVIAIDRKGLGFTEDDILICCVANVRAFKGIPYLIKAFQNLSNEKNIHLLLIGNRFDEEPIHSIILKSPFAKNIHVLGYRDDSLSILASCDACILASTHGEALTKSVIEAMCLGIPPIITDISGNKNLVIDGESGWLVPPRDAESLSKAILDMSRNKSERIRRGANAKEQIRENFHTDRTVMEFIELYVKLKQI